MEIVAGTPRPADPELMRREPRAVTLSRFRHLRERSSTVTNTRKQSMPIRATTILFAARRAVHDEAHSNVASCREASVGHRRADGEALTLVGWVLVDEGGAIVSPCATLSDHPRKEGGGW